jgi:hypothetical protein
MIESMHRRPRKGGAEYDAFSRFGKKYYRWHPGERAAIKARHNRRVRHQVHQALNYGG